MTEHWFVYLWQGSAVHGGVQPQGPPTDAGQGLYEGQPHALL